MNFKRQPCSPCIQSLGKLFTAMDMIQNELVSVLEKMGAKFSTMSKSEVEAISRELRSRFCDAKEASSPLWEAIKSSESFYKEDGTHAVVEFFGKRQGEIVFLIDDWHGCSGIRLLDAEIVPKALEGLYSFKWYATDSNCSFLICRNDHDFV